MTEAAIAADSGSAPADIGGAPLLDVVPTQNSPLPAQTGEVADKPASLDDVLDRAMAKANEKQAAKEAPAAKPEAKADAKPVEAKDAKPDVKPEAKEPQPRENGRFVSTKPAEQQQQPAQQQQQVKPSHTAGDPPARFTQDVKDIWATLPENARGEITRMERELTEGLNKYRGAAERDGKLNEFHEMARQAGKELPNVVREYVNMENLLRQDPVRGLETLCQRMGYSLRQVAEHVLGQTPDQQAAQQDQTILELRNQIATLQQQIGGVQQTFQQQQETAISREVNQFKAAHPRFDELAEDIAFFLQTRCPGDLAQAYELAERLNPAPAQAKADTTEASSAPVIDLQVQTEKGNKSVNGAPSSAGSEPKQKRRSSSIDEALDRAMARTG
jgi:hypothetical protein